MEILQTCAYIIATSVQIFLKFILLAMFVRAILSWFVSPDSGVFHVFYTVTEPFVVPFRALLVKLNLLQDSSLDFSFVLAYFSIWFVSMLLPTVPL